MELDLTNGGFVQGGGLLRSGKQTLTEWAKNLIQGTESSWCLNDKESACKTGELGLIPWSERYPLEKGMTPHSSTLAWEIPRTEEPGRLQSMWSQSWT